MPTSLWVDGDAICCDILVSSTLRRTFPCLFRLFSICVTLGADVFTPGATVFALLSSDVTDALLLRVEVLLASTGTFALFRAGTELVVGGSGTASAPLVLLLSAFGWRSNSEHCHDQKTEKAVGATDRCSALGQCPIHFSTKLNR